MTYHQNAYTNGSSSASTGTVIHSSSAAHNLIPIHDESFAMLLLTDTAEERRYLPLHHTVQNKVGTAGCLTLFEDDKLLTIILNRIILSIKVLPAWRVSSPTGHKLPSHRAVKTYASGSLTLSLHIHKE